MKKLAGALCVGTGHNYDLPNVTGIELGQNQKNSAGEGNSFPLNISHTLTDNWSCSEATVGLNVWHELH